MNKAPRKSASKNSTFSEATTQGMKNGRILPLDTNNLTAFPQANLCSHPYEGVTIEFRQKPTTIDAFFSIDFSLYKSGPRFLCLNMPMDDHARASTSNRGCRRSMPRPTGATSSFDLLGVDPGLVGPRSRPPGSPHSLVWWRRCTNGTADHPRRCDKRITRVLRGPWESPRRVLSTRCG
jgi:hypothetical protein